MTKLLWPSHSPFWLYKSMPVWQITTPFRICMTVLPSKGVIAWKTYIFAKIAEKFVKIRCSEINIFFKRVYILSISSICVLIWYIIKTFIVCSFLGWRQSDIKIPSYHPTYGSRQLFHIKGSFQVYKVTPLFFSFSWPK